MDREGELYKSDVDDPGEICPEAIEEEAQWDAIINQPIDGLLYDLDLLPEEITTEGQRATASIITEMHKRLATTRAQLSEWNHIKALFREEARYRKDSRNPYGSHGHQMSGIWDSDNGPLAGHECAACAAARVAMEDKEAK